ARTVAALVCPLLGGRVQRFGESLEAEVAGRELGGLERHPLAGARAAGLRDGALLLGGCHRPSSSSFGASFAIRAYARCPRSTPHSNGAPPRPSRQSRLRAPPASAAEDSKEG